MNISAHATVLIVLCAACASADRTRGAGGPTAGDAGATVDGGVATGPGVPMRTDAELPSSEPAPSDLMREVLAACQRVIADAERQVVSRCAYSADTLPLVDAFAQVHADAVALRSLPGRGLEAFGLPPEEITLAGDAIEILPCSRNPLCEPGASCSHMNAFALRNLVVTLDPLLLSFAEGAAFWGILAEHAGGDPSMVDEVELYEGLGRIYNGHANGSGFTVVDQATVVAMIEEDPFVGEVWAGATAFLILHEIGHADLDHGVINHTASVGARAILMSEGRTLTAEEDAELQAELRSLKVFTETQADIYSATLLEQAGYSSAGPIVLFTVAMSAYLVASGACDHSMDQTQLYDCALAADPQASHPPLDVRATVISRIIDGGEDLTHLLDPNVFE